MSNYDLSYASPGDPAWKQALMRGIENLSGRGPLLAIYNRWRRDVAGKSPRQWAEALAMIGTRLELDGDGNWREQVPCGPLIIIANHPFGLADGIAILSIAESLGRPYRILINAEILRVPELVPVSLPIDFAPTPAAQETNLRTRAEARKLIKEGTTLIVFPAGGVATAENPFGTAEELPWKQFVVRLIQQSGASVLPVYFHGQNSRLFHFISRYSLMLRLALLVSEFRHHVGGHIRATVGRPLSSAELTAVARDGRSVLEELYVAVHRLAPGKENAGRGQLLPRPAAVRRRYPWDPRPAGSGSAMSRLRKLVGVPAA
jgi:putative hemolysin